MPVWNVAMRESSILHPHSFARNSLPVSRRRFKGVAIVCILVLALLCEHVKFPVQALGEDLTRQPSLARQAKDTARSSDPPTGASPTSANNPIEVCFVLSSKEPGAYPAYSKCAELSRTVRLIAKGVSLSVGVSFEVSSNASNPDGWALANCAFVNIKDVAICNKLQPGNAARAVSDYTDKVLSQVFDAMFNLSSSANATNPASPKSCELYVPQALMFTLWGSNGLVPTQQPFFPTRKVNCTKTVQPRCADVVDDLPLMLQPVAKLENFTNNGRVITAWCFTVETRKPTRTAPEVCRGSPLIQSFSLVANTSLAQKVNVYALVDATPREQPRLAIIPPAWSLGHMPLTITMPISKPNFAWRMDQPGGWSLSGRAKLCLEVLGGTLRQLCMGLVCSVFVSYSDRCCTQEWVGIP